MNKNNLIKIFLILTIVIILISIFYLLSKQTKKEPSNLIVNPTLTGTQTGEIKFTGQEIETPTKLGIYKNSGESIDRFAISLALKFNLPQSNFSKDVWISTDGKKALSIDRYNNLIQYTVDQQEETSTISNRPSLSKAKESVFKLLTDLSLNNIISNEPKIINYYSGLEWTPSSPQNADIIEMYFSQTIENVPVNIEVFDFSDIIVVVGNNNIVLKIVFPQKIIPSQKITEKNLISFKEAVNFVENKKGSLIEISDNEKKLNTQQQLGNVNLNSSILEYRLAQKENIFYPYYKFLGTSVVKDTNQPVSIIIIIPAVSTP